MQNITIVGAVYIKAVNVPKRSKDENDEINKNIENELKEKV